MVLKEVTRSYINVYTCTHDLFIGGLFTLQKYCKIKVNACILTHPITIYRFGELF